MAISEFKGMSTPELEKVLQRKMDEVYEIRRELDRRKGDGPKPVAYNFEERVTS